MLYFSDVQRFSKACVLLASSLVGSLILIDSVQAASLASSKLDLKIEDISLVPFKTIVDAVETTLIDAQDGVVESQKQVIADFQVDPPSSLINTKTLLSGTGTRYRGLSISDISTLGSFEVNPGDILSFNFSGFVKLEVTVDDPQTEWSAVFAEIGFEVFDSERPLSLIGGLELSTATLATQQNIFEQNILTENVTLNNFRYRSQGSDLRQVSALKFSGSFYQTFTEEAEITLMGFGFSEHEIRTVPEPGMVMGFMVILGNSLLVGVSSALKYQRHSR